MPAFLCDRLAPETRTPIEFTVHARDGVEAAHVAAEVAYAAAWVEGSYPVPSHHKGPDQGCLAIAEEALGYSSADVQSYVDDGYEDAPWEP